MIHSYDPDIETDDDRDLPVERRYTEHGQTAVIFPSQPHGFWRIKLDKKKNLPPALDGAFTGLAEAEKAVTVYFNSLKASTPATSSN